MIFFSNRPPSPLPDAGALVAPDAGQVVHLAPTTLATLGEVAAAANVPDYGPSLLLGYAADLELVGVAIRAPVRAVLQGASELVRFHGLSPALSGGVAPFPGPGVLRCACRSCGTGSPCRCSSCARSGSW